MQIGIDLGATKIEYVLLDVNNSEILRKREKTPKNYKKLLTLLSNIISKLSEECNKILDVGICHPGSMDKNGKVLTPII